MKQEKLLKSDVEKVIEWIEGRIEDIDTYYDSGTDIIPTAKKALHIGMEEWEEGYVDLSAIEKLKLR